MYPKIINFISFLITLAFMTMIAFFIFLILGCKTFEPYDKSNIKEENIYYTTLDFYSGKNIDKNDIVIKEAMDRLYQKLDKVNIENKEDFCRKVSFGKDPVNEDDKRFSNYQFCIAKKITIE